MLLNNLFNVVFIYAAVESAVGINDNDRTERAKTEATGCYELNLLGESEITEIFLESFYEAMATLRGTACTPANKHVCTNHYISS